MGLDLESLWKNTCELLKSQMNYVSYSTWVDENMTPVKLEGNTVVISCKMESVITMIQKKYLPLIEKCLTYISVHLHEPVGLEDLSRHCNLCGRSLSLRFRKELGMSIPDYIHREKLREAEYMLRHTDYSLSAITMYLNYPSQSYFTQVFKKYRGQTPQQYRDRK